MSSIKWYPLPDMFRKNYYQIIVKIADEVEMAREYLSSGFNLRVQIQRG